MKPILLNTSLKQHSLLGLACGLWLVVFLIFISPFDVADLTFKNKLILLPPYGFLFFLGYMSAVGIQNLIFRFNKQWSIVLEFFILIIIYVIVLGLCFAYYKTDWINGTYSFVDYVTGVYLPILLIFAVVLSVGRMYLNKLQAKKDSLKITLMGTNKDDILKINPDAILCISGAQNYVEIYYLLNGKRQKELLRATLKSIQDQAVGLTQVHRSHLINIDHFTKWIDSNTILIYDIEIPISKTYKVELKDQIKVRHSQP